jgi:phosphate/phosphite/phosphonate ABC transporter binding protein
MRKPVLLLLCLVLGILAFVRWRSWQNPDSLSVTWTIAAQAPLAFGVIPYLTPGALREEIGPLVDFLSKQLQRPVEMVVAADYEMLGNMLEYGKVHLAWFSSTSFEKLDTHQRWEALCRPIRNGAIGHYGEIIVRADQPYRTIWDLKGTRLALVDKNSGTGFIYPNRYFEKLGIDPLVFFREVSMTGNHTYSIEGVLNGTYDVAATFDINRQARIAKGNASFTVIAETGHLLNDPIVVRKDFDPKLKQTIQRLFLTINQTPEGRTLMEHLSARRQWQRFVDEAEAQRLIASHVVAITEVPESSTPQPSAPALPAGEPAVFELPDSQPPAPELPASQPSVTELPASPPAVTELPASQSLAPPPPLPQSLVFPPPALTNLPASSGIVATPTEMR